MQKILVIALGGTIASVKKEKIDLDKNIFKILNYCKSNAEFCCVSPFSILSENMSIPLLQQLIDYIAGVDFNKYIGAIILHGSDTLAFTSNIIANCFADKNIILVASDKPVEDKTANGINNFNNAVNLLLSGKKGVFVSYNSIHLASQITSADCNDNFVDCAACKVMEKRNNLRLSNKKVLIIKLFVGIDFDCFSIDNIDIVLCEMYHSATAPSSVKTFANKCKNKGVKFYFVTHKSSADYVSASNFSNIIFNSTIENAYAKILLN